MQDCPVVVAIKEIRGGFYADESGFGDEFLVKLGGSDGIDRVCDNVSFYVMKRKLEFARFKLSKPNQQQCVNKYHLMFDHVLKGDSTYRQLYDDLADKLFHYLYDQFIAMVDVIGEMEKFIAIYIQIAAIKNMPLNLSLPDVIFLPDTDIAIMRSPKELAEVTNRVIKYMNGININAIIKDPIVTRLETVAEYEGPMIGDEVVSSVSEDWLIKMEETLKHEMNVADVLVSVEKYHCVIINRMNDVIDRCKKIMKLINSL
jgi:hypothetical protein